MPRNFINWSCKLTLYQRERDGGGGQPPVKSEGRAQSSKVGRLWFWGVDAQRISRGTPEARSCFCVCWASFLMTFATGGVPHTGSRHTNISKKDVLHLFILYLTIFHIFHDKPQWSRLECFWLSFLDLYSRHRLLQRLPSLYPSLALSVEPSCAPVTFYS